MQQLLLSICIPTYNRSEYLEYLLKNIISQLNENNLWDTVEICISDNASTDNTEDIVNKYKLEYPKIIYHRNSQNVGFDRNLLQSVAISHGTYCWLFGSDDRFEPKAIITMVEYLKKNHGLSGVSVNVQNYNNDFSFQVHNPSFRSKLNYDFVENAASKIYIKLGQCFSFISGQIINRDQFDKVVNSNDISKYFNGYIHLYIIARIIYHAPKWSYLSQVMVGWRGDNDSALTRNYEGYLKRLRLDYEYFRIAKDVFGKYSFVYYRHANQVCGQFIFCNLHNLKTNVNANMLSLFFEITSKFWIFPNYYLKLLPVFILPKSFIKKIKSIFRKPHNKILDKN